MASPSRRRKQEGVPAETPAVTPPVAAAAETPTPAPAAAVPTELAAALQRLANQLQQQQRQKSVRDNLDLIDDWQGMLQSNPETALKQLKKFESKYREMLLSGQVNLQTYLQLYQLNLIFVILFALPQALRREHSALL